MVEAGCDEAGRGCLAGPVCAAAVILPADPGPILAGLLNDSKLLSAPMRQKLRKLIAETAISYGVAMVDAQTIDKVNILKASIKAMHLALSKLSPQPALILADGNSFYPYRGVSHLCIIRGDATYASVAAASVMAKTYRDDYMQQLHKEYPHYGWYHNKGYATSFHREAIAAYGISPYHRRSFRQLPQLRLDFTSRTCL